jgi:AhpD family alkylhydroperoxidase
MMHSFIGKLAGMLVGLLALSFIGTVRAEPPAAARPAEQDIQRTLGFVPGFFKAVPDSALPGVWEEMKGLQLNPKTTLPGKTKELVGLAVSAQVPCRYCVYAHTEFAKLNSASQAEIAEAVAIAGAQRHWNAYLYGSELDDARFRSELDRIVAHVKSGKAPARSISVVDAASARQDIEQTFGFVPEFLRRVPAAALPGAWRELKELRLSEKTRIGAKEKALIALGVASQTSSRACVAAEIAFAKLAGASDAEMSEAVGMAAITRNMSTLLNGLQVDENAFVRDIDRLVAGVKAAQKAQPQPARVGQNR